MVRAATLALVLLVSSAASAPAGAQTQNLADTPQGKVVLAFYKAAHAGDVAAVSKLVTAESIVSRAVAGSNRSTSTTDAPA